MNGFLQAKQPEMLQMLEEIVNIDSGSKNKVGVDRIGCLLSERYEKLGFDVTVFNEKTHGNNLVIKHKEATDPKIMFVAHMDTVFKAGTVARRPFSIKNDKAFGPGIIDMKGSHVALLYSVKALINAGSKAYKNIEMVLNSDEEIGSPTSRELIEQHAIGKEYALIMEPAREDGSVVTARKGTGRYSLCVKGKAAHSGIEPEKGRNAIEEMARKIIKIHQLNDADEGISVSVGLVEGGTSVNTIPAYATAEIDLRISRLEQAEFLESQLQAICVTQDVPGTVSALAGGFGDPPMIKNVGTVKLLEVVQEEGKKIGVHITDTSTGGGSDASHTSAMGIPTIDGMGPVGGNAHSEEEYLEIPSLVERALLLANVTERLSEKH